MAIANRPSLNASIHWVSVSVDAREFCIVTLGDLMKMKAEWITPAVWARSGPERE